MGRFYKSAASKKSETGWQVLLDGKPIRTPMKHVFTLPTEKLAHEVALEWNAQGEKIDKLSMPLMGYSSVAIDIVPNNRKDLILEMLAFSQTDLLCYRSDDEKLIARQSALFDPLVEKVKTHYGISLQVTKGVMPVDQPAGNEAIVERLVAKLDDFRFAGLMSAMQTLGSIYLALLLKDFRIDADMALRAARFDEMAQAERWGITDTHMEKQKQVYGELAALVRFFKTLEA